jgi:ABC-2 type transport system ATP-binding protein
MAKDNILEVKNVSKAYYNHKALNNVSLTVPKGCIYGLLGPNGAGKTSLIRIITQITAPDEGTLLFDGESLSEKHIQQIGYLPEERGLYKKMKVKEQLIYFAELRGLHWKEIEKKLDYWETAFQMREFWNKNVEDLSKGMQQKVQFVAAVLHEPKLIILDEPFSGFDPVNAELLTNEIMKLRERGATIIFSTHRMETVESLCDYIALINKSEKILEGTKSEIKNRFKKNEYRILTKEPLTFEDSAFVVTKSGQDEYGYFVHVSCKNAQGNDWSANEILQKVLTRAEVISFSEILPDMSDIFISVVENHVEA